MAAMASPTTRSIARNVYLLPLTDGGAPDVPGTYIYLPAPSEPAYSIRFTIPGTSSICRHGTLWVNIPEKHEEFHGDNYKAYPLRALLRPLCTNSPLTRQQLDSGLQHGHQDRYPCLQ